MARLLVFRGEILDREIELARLPFRIGRGSTNDLVLEDPVKSVSREHAEIRLDGGRYVLVDRQSENGIWVAGKRCPTIAFEAETIATVGPFRLKVEGAPTVPVVEPTVVRSSPVVTEGALQAKPKKATPPPQPRTVRTPAAAAWTLRKLTRQQLMMIGGAAALVAIVALIVVGVVLRSSRQRQRDQDARQMAAWISQASVQLDRGACAEALSQIQLALARQPNSSELLILKQRAETCLTPSPEPPPPPPDPIVLALESARERIANRDCATALNELNVVLGSNPENAEALDLKAVAEKCGPVPPPRMPPGPKPPLLAKKVPPEEGGLEPQANELDVDYQTRIKSMRARYDEAVEVASKGSTATAVRTFEGLARETPPRYLDLAAKLADARRVYRATAQPLMREAQELAAREQWDEAIAKFRQAQQIDSTLPVEPEIAKIRDAKMEAGNAACAEARRRINFFRTEGVAAYRRVLELLPPEDQCSVEARRVLGVR